MSEGRSKDLNELGFRVRQGPLEGAASVQVAFFRQGDSRYLQPTPSGGTITKGIPIEQLRKRLGGNEGYVAGPTGEKHYLELPADLPNGQGIMVGLKFTVVETKKRHG